MQRLVLGYDHHLPVAILRATLGITLFASCASGLPPIAQSPRPSDTLSCVDAGQYLPPTTASYAPGVLEGQQSSVAQGVGFDRLRPDEAAAEYLAAAGLANGTNALGVRTVAQNATDATAIACLRDGTKIRVTLYHPFPADPKPIWAVRNYQKSQ